MDAVGDNLGPLVEHALTLLPEPYRGAVVAALGAVPEPAWRARQRALAARDAALATAAGLLPPGSPTAKARALAAALGRFAAAGYVPGDRPADELRAALHDCLVLNGGEPLGWFQLRRIITGESRAG